MTFHATTTHGGVCREWIVDSEASDHMCASRDAFVDYRTHHSNRTVLVAKLGVTLRMLGVGTVVLELNCNAVIQSVAQTTGTVCARLENTLHVENLSSNLFLIQAILAKAMQVSMDINGCEIYWNGKVVGSGTKRGNFIYLNVANGTECHVASGFSDLWHRQFDTRRTTRLQRSLRVT